MVPEAACHGSQARELLLHQRRCSRARCRYDVVGSRILSRLSSRLLVMAPGPNRAYFHVRRESWLHAQVCKQCSAFDFDQWMYAAANCV
jgi:hypothetical protein